MATLAEIERLSYWYPDTSAPALDDVSLVLEGGLTLVGGNSGGGKSTLLRLLNGLVPHFHGGRISGRADIAGRDVLRTLPRDMARRVGFVFQDPEVQFVYGSVEREVAFGLENLAVPRAEMVDRVDEALQAVGATGLRARRVATLSGGEKQRVALAAVLAMRPTLLVLDEPTSQLDPEGAAALVAACLALVEAGSALVVSGHRMKLLAGTASRRLTVWAGRLEEASPPADLEPGAGPEPVSPGPGKRAWETAWEAVGVAAGAGGVPVLSGVELGGTAGEVTALMGPNGSGKTTLLRVLAGLLPPLEGSVRRAPGRVAYLPSDPTSLLHLPSVRAEVEQTLRWSGEGGDADALLAELGLAGLAGRYPRDLSGGERQRSALAAVLAGRPALALLDEPTRGMDAAARAALVGLVRRLAGEGTAVVIATHDRELAAAVAHRMVRLEAGRAIAEPRTTWPEPEVPAR